ncbi:MAG TPA: alpha/beta hydrolase [Kofleriaceae bacterium]
MATLTVPGATIYYETRGRGPTLVMIPGGPTDAGSFEMLAASLEREFTTVALDPRGNSRSVLDGPPIEQDLHVHADDTAAVIAAVGNGPAIVLGSSGGAQVGLALAARAPASVRVLVAHEPPCVTLLPDADVVLAGFDRVAAAFERDGARAAMAAFAELAGFDQAPAPPSAHTTRMAKNLDYFVRYFMRRIAAYRPDLAALRDRRVIVGVGATSTGQLAHRCAVALANALGIKPVVFPGGHVGFAHEGAEFARVLRTATE